VQYLLLFQAYGISKMPTYQVQLLLVKHFFRHFFVKDPQLKTVTAVFTQRLSYYAA
jgi:hypothetical protein